jgi:hypothetical protein
MLRIFGVSLQNCKLFRLFVGFALPLGLRATTSATEAFAVYGPRRKFARVSQQNRLPDASPGTPAQRSELQKLASANS